MVLWSCGKNGPMFVGSVSRSKTRVGGSAFLAGAGSSVQSPVSTMPAGEVRKPMNCMTHVAPGEKQKRQLVCRRRNISISTRCLVGT